MSRNVRQKHPTTPVKVARKRRVSDSSSSLDLSDESGYSEVEAISESEDEDEEDVKAAEENYILSRGFVSSPRPSEDADKEDTDEDADEDDDEEDNEDDDVEEEDEEAEESASWEGFMSDVEDDGNLAGQANIDMSTAEEDVPVVERRVRFDVPYSSDEDSTETEDEHDLFPDIFVDQNALDPSFRREIEDDPDDSSNSGTFWDYHGHYEGQNHHDMDMDMNNVFDPFVEDDTPIATPMHSQEIPTAASTPLPSAEDENASLDGYESDGDTTEEEDIPDPPVRRKIRREVVEEESDSEIIPIKPRRGQPRVGRFNLDASGKKPIAVVNPITRKMMIFTPQRLRRLDLSPEQFNFQFFEQDPQSSPILSNSANLMMSAMFSSNTFGDFMNTQAVGPAEAFFMPSDTNFLEDVSESECEEEADEDVEEKKLQLEDFITFDGDTDDENKDNDWIAHNEVSSTPARPTTASSDVHPLLDHFENNSNAVGAFRRDQINQRLISSRKATRDSLAFGGSYGPIRGIKNGRLGSTNVPISPMRKPKKPSVDLASSPLSTLSQKRKASSDHPPQNWGHKKQRSISDVNFLHI